MTPPPRDPSVSELEVRVLAPAKLNLSLELLGKRADGYHELATHMVAIEPRDELLLRMAPASGLQGPKVAFRLEAADPDVPRDGTNLAVRALGLVVAKALERGADASRHYELELKKNLPAGAGLGGGSADAAAAYYAATSLLGLDPEDDELMAELARLGSDIPFFVRARETGFGLATGRGEIIEPLPVPPELWFAVLTPELHVKTPEVYAHVCPPFRPRPSFDLEAFRRAPVELRRTSLRNDLEGPALRAAPMLESWFEILREVPGAPWRLSGSGASFFGLFAQCDEARAALDHARELRETRALTCVFETVCRAANHGVLGLSRDGAPRP